MNRNRWNNLLLLRQATTSISSGEIRFGNLKAADVIGEVVTVGRPASVAVNDEYYVKVVDLAPTGRDCIVADGTLEVVAEDYPTVTIDESTGIVGDTPEIAVEDADDYADVTVDWKEYDSDNQVVYAGAIVDGEYTVEDYAIPHDFKGTYKIVVWLTDADGDTFGSWVEFTIEPDVDWDLVLAPNISILANELDQTFTITGTGFSAGTVAEDGIQFIENFVTGSQSEHMRHRHEEVDVDEYDEVDASGRTQWRCHYTCDGRRVEPGEIDARSQYTAQPRSSRPHVLLRANRIGSFTPSQTTRCPRPRDRTATTSTLAL